MNKLLLTLLALLGSSPLSAEPRLDGAGMSIPRNLIASGGGLSSGGGLTLDSAVGESEVSTFTSAANNSFGGLMHEIAQPGSVISLVSVTKGTGTITLSWSAPGLDGFVGGVLSGYWRIDTSSDPLHVFAPTTYTTEIATTVAVGDAASYQLTGLLANTTYYSRVYLADARKYFAETSAQDNDSTLARVPVTPFFSGVFQTSVTITWNLPAGGAEGFKINASTASGQIVSSTTFNGNSVTLTVTGLRPASTYFFNVGSLNWQSDVNFATVMSTVTFPGGPLPILNLAYSADNLGRVVTFTWTNQAFPFPSGVTILVSTNPIVFTPTDGVNYPVGTVLPDGSVVKSSAPTPGASYAENSLTLDVTGYFSFYSRDTLNAYSVAVSTLITLDLPPMAPAGLSGVLGADGSSITLNWWQVASNLDGSLFRNAFAPDPFELNRYEVWRSTGIMHPNWVYVGSAPATALSYVASVPVPGAVYFYKVVSKDAFNSALADAAMAVDTLGNLYALHPDQVTRLQIPVNVAGMVQPYGNSYARPLLVRAHDRPQDIGGRVVKSVSFDPVRSPSNEGALLPAGPTPMLNVAMHYETSGGFIVPSGLRSLSLNPAVNASDATNWLTAYYVQGQNAAKVFGQVDQFDQTVGVSAPYFGIYQIRTTLRPQGFNFDLSGISNKVITPNGDGLNDTVVFTFNNPQDSAVSGKMFDVRGRYVADLLPGPVAGASLVWDGRGNGAIVPRGVYVYQIRAEGRTFSGTVVVVR